MEARIDLVTIWTDALPPMRNFYRDVLGFEIELALDSAAGQIVELAFPCASPDAVDASYARLIEKGATPIKPPADMPWNQRTALIADPDGNIHEIFANLEG